MQLQQKKSPALVIILCTLAAALIAGGVWFFLNREGEEAEPVTRATEEEPQAMESVRLIDFASNWKYTAPPIGTDWPKKNFDDSSWAEGKSPLGFGDDIIATVIGKKDGPVTYYLRKSIEIDELPESAQDGKFVARFQFDDGFRLFLNGKVVTRKNLRGGKVKFATRSRTGAQEETFGSFDLPPGSLRAGTNVFAVELFQATATSSDLRFAMVLDFVKEGESLPPALPKG